jgi:hypothetical protein
MVCALVSEIDFVDAFGPVIKDSCTGPHIFHGCLKSIPSIVTSVHRGITRVLLCKPTHVRPPSPLATPKQLVIYQDTRPVTKHRRNGKRNCKSCSVGTGERHRRHPGTLSPEEFAPWSVRRSRSTRPAQNGRVHPHPARRLNRRVVSKLGDHRK